MIDVPRFIVRHAVTGARLAEVPVARGETAYSALARRGVPVRTTCRGSTICGLCVAEVDEADQLAPPGAVEAALLPEGAPRARLLCQLRLPAGLRALTVRILPP